MLEDVFALLARCSGELSPYRCLAVLLQEPLQGPVGELALLCGWQPGYRRGVLALEGVGAVRRPYPNALSFPAPHVPGDLAMTCYLFVQVWRAGAGHAAH